MTIINSWFAIKILFDPKGYWVTSETGTRMYVPLGLIYEPSDDIGNLYGAMFLCVLVAVLIRKRGSVTEACGV